MTVGAVAVVLDSRQIEGPPGLLDGQLPRPNIVAAAADPHHALVMLVGHPWPSDPAEADDSSHQPWMTSCNNQPAAVVAVVAGP